MKNIILTIVLILSFNLSAQDSYQPLMFIEPLEPIELNLNTSYGYPEESNMPIGVGMMLGGATFIVAVNKSNTFGITSSGIVISIR